MSSEANRPPESQPLSPTARLPGVQQSFVPNGQPSRVLQPAAALPRPIPAPGHSQVVPQLPPRRSPRPAGRFIFLRSLRWRLTIMFVGFLAAAFLLLGAFLFLAIRPYLRNEALTRVQVAAAKQFTAHRTAFESAVQVHLGQSSPAFEETIGAAINGLTDVQQVLMIDPRTSQVVAGTSGATIGQSAPYLQLDRLRTQLKQGNDSVTYQPPASGLGIVLIGFSCRSCTDLRRIDHLAVIEVITNFDSVNTVIARLMLYVAIGMAALVLIAALLGMPLMRRALRPLSAMTAITQAIASGDLSQRVNLPHSGDEIGELATSLDEMIDRIEAAFAAQRESEERMRQFVADASHELRTPLTSLRGFTDVLLRGAKDDPETAERVLRAMQRESERMSRLVQDLLTLARLDAGRQLGLQQFDLVALVGEAVDQARILAGSRTVTMRTDGGGSLLVVADQDKIKQVLLILLDNALKYGRQGPDGWVQAQISRSPDTAQIIVVDNGPGIKPEDLPHIFERFYRADKTRSRSGYTNIQPAIGGPPSNSGVLRAMNAGGSGLGLPIALAIIQAHGGSIWAQSQVGQGTQFTIRLPRQMEERPPVA
jgi:signal transduction histidine kinase